MKLAITMPTGKIGGKLTNELLDRGGHELRLLTRDRSKVRDASQRGAKVFEGRLEDRDFFTRATAGVDSLFMVLPIDSRSENLSRDCTQIIDSAVHAVNVNHVPRVVFVSSLGAHLTEGTGPVMYLRQAEEKLREAAPNLTVLRPVFFMDQFTGWMQDIADHRAVYLPFSENTTIPMIATRDIATFAADVLTDARWTGRRVLPLYGPKEYSFREAANILGKTLGTDVTHVELTPKEVGERLRRRGWSREAVDRHLELQQAWATGKLVDELPRSKWETRPTTFEEFAKRDFRPAFDKVGAVHA